MQDHIELPEARLYELDYVDGYLKGRVGRWDVSMEDAKFRTFKDRINAAAIEAYPWLRQKET